MKRLYLLLLVAIMVLLTACSSSDSNKTPTVENNPAAKPPAVELSFEPIIEGSTLKLSGQTNLPDGAMIAWQVMPKDHPENTQEGAAKVENGQWQASISLENIPKGELEVWAGFQTIMPEESKQPAEIISMYGEAGENITGPLAKKVGGITRAELIKTITY
jgi:hypothetical protein